MFLKHIFPNKKYYFRQFIYIWILSILGNLYLFFLTQRIHELPNLISILTFVLFSLFYGLIIWLGIKLTVKSNLDALNPHKFIKTDLIPALIATAVAVTSIFILNRVVIKIPVEDLTFLGDSPFWAKITSSFYSGLTEEILFRLFLLPLIYFLLKKIFRKKTFHRSFIWMAIVIAAFSPMILTFPSIDNLTIARLVILNLVGGTIYGYLFVYKSFWAGTIAHFLVEFLINGI